MVGTSIPKEMFFIISIFHLEPKQAFKLLSSFIIQTTPRRLNCTRYHSNSGNNH
jgi:hypothetical protein